LPGFLIIMIQLTLYMAGTARQFASGKHQENES
jgi:hypothetical protein